MQVREWGFLHQTTHHMYIPKELRILTTIALRRDVELWALAIGSIVVPFWDYLIQ